MPSLRPRLAAICLSASLLWPAITTAEVLDHIVAVVDDGVVLKSDLDREMEQAMVQLRSRGITAPSESALRAQVLEKIVITRVQTQRAQQAGIRIDDRELNEVLANIARENRVSLAEFAQLVREEGGDYLAIREQIRDEVLVARLRQKEVDQRVSITEQDVDLYLAAQTVEDDSEYRLSHILVAIPDGATPEQREQARVKADRLRQELEAGADFAALAASSSDGQQALQGGDLDWRKPDTLPLLFLQAARKLQPTQLSPVLEAAGGYHLIKLVELRGGGAERKMTDETQVRHILIQPNAIRTEEQAQLQARDVHDRLAKGEDFAKLATELSDDPGSKNSGGDLGWQAPGVYSPDFQGPINQLAAGERSTPFRTQFGWHVAEVLGRRTRDVTEEARRGAARIAIQNRRAAEEYDTWLRRLRAEAYVEMRGPGGSAVVPAEAAAPAT